jgi:hypothetical protein
MDEQIFVFHKHKINKILNSEPEMDHKRKYEKHTINSKNIFVRVAHRSRTIKGIEYIYNELQSGKLLDYGCGTGVFISILENFKKGVAIGYEPNYKGKFRKDIPIFSDFSEVQLNKPFDIITIFEVIEHLSNENLDVFLLRSNEILSEDGIILISVPIEMGLGLIIKEIYRINKRKKIEYKPLEFIKATFLGIPGERIRNPAGNYGSHKGFDFRKLVKYISMNCWEANVVGYGPIPIKTWYINSQVFIKVRRRKFSEKTGTSLTNLSIL